MKKQALVVENTYANHTSDKDLNTEFRHCPNATVTANLKLGRRLSETFDGRAHADRQEGGQEDL